MEKKNYEINLMLAVLTGFAVWASAELFVLKLALA